MAIRRVTGAVSPSELIFADANALGATYSGSGTTIERGETFTLPAGGTTAVSNGALRLEALKGDCTITNNGNSTLTNASGVNGTILMRSGASDFPAFVRNSSMGSMSTPVREDFTGDVSGTINSNVTFPAGTVINLETKNIADTAGHSLTTTESYLSGLTFTYDVKEQTSKLYVEFHLLLQTEHDGTTYSHKFSLRSSVDNYASNIGGGSLIQEIHYGTTAQVHWIQRPSIVSCFHDHNQIAGTTIAYRLYGSANGNKGIYAWDQWGDSSPTTTQHAVIYEVAQ